MKKGIFVLLLFLLLLCSCSKEITEEPVSVRLPADTVTQTEKKEYQYLEKKELRNEDIISRPYFFKDGNTDGAQAEYEGNGITASLRLIKADTTESEDILQQEMDAVAEELSAYEPVVGDVISGDGYRISTISYVKQVNEKEGKKVSLYQYPCKVIFKMETLADGSFLLMSLLVDNETATGETEALLSEFLDAYDITFS